MNPYQSPRESSVRPRWDWEPMLFERVLAVCFLPAVLVALVLSMVTGRIVGNRLFAAICALQVVFLLGAITTAQDYRPAGPLAPVDHGGRQAGAAASLPGVPPAVQEVGILFPFKRAGNQSIPAKVEYYAVPRSTLFPWNIKYTIRKRVTLQPQGGGGCQPAPLPQGVPSQPPPGIRYDVKPPQIEYQQTLATAGKSDYWTWTKPSPHHRAAVRLTCANMGTTGVYVDLDGVTGILTCEHGKRQGSPTRIEFADGRVMQPDAPGVYHDKGGNDVAFLPVKHPSIKPLKVAKEAARPNESVEVLGYGGIRQTLRHYVLTATGREANANGGKISWFAGNVMQGDSGAALLNDDREVVGVMNIGGSPIAHIGKWPVLSPTGAARHQDIAAFCSRVSQHVQCGPGGCSPAPSVVGGGGGWDQAYPPGPGTVPPPRITTPKTPTPAKCECDEAEIIRVILETIKTDPAFRGPAGADGAPGTPGADGSSEPPKIRVGVVTTVASGSQASASIREENGEWVLDLSIPQGVDGPPGEPGKTEPPQVTWSHVVLVADSSSKGWPRLQSEYKAAQDHYSGLRQIEPPADNVGPIPALIAYEIGTPVQVWRGSREVSDALSKLARGEYDQFLSRSN